jgi:hemolysin III
MAQHLATGGNLLIGRLADLGPRYAETNLAQFPVEPWATWTNLIFLFVIVYWARRLRGRWRRHRVLSMIALPLLTLGWFGGTVYHATRSHAAWLFLDWGPILLLILLAAAWLWLRLLPKVRSVCGGAAAVPLVVVALLAPPLVAAVFARPLANSGPAGISASYALLSTGVIVPAVLNCVRQRGAWPWLAAILVCFAIALLFRTADASLAQAGWPHGSHYLWHLFGGLATFCTFGFLHRLREADMQPGHRAALD